MIIYFFKKIKKQGSFAKNEGFVLIELMVALAILMITFKGICCLDQALARSQNDMMTLLRGSKPSLLANQRAVPAAARAYVKIVSAHKIPAWCSRGVIVDEETVAAQAR
ncbi:prepilin-type N-terminal cleavage/methylation domain-containing protein [Candidatus Babeliales bacterium]|nr:prepilin-type N-terminal cleavage/methylation domain-containing protein [Candidatus Babeliales bacterium]